MINVAKLSTREMILHTRVVVSGKANANDDKFSNIWIEIWMFRSEFRFSRPSDESAYASPNPNALTSQSLRETIFQP